MTNDYQIRLCENPACGLRYPIVKEHPYGERCPACLGSTIVIHKGELLKEEFTEPLFLYQNKLEALLDNIRSAWNVGAIFRSADGLGVEKLYLCGITPTPTNLSVRKTALGSDTNVPWVYSRNAIHTALKIKYDGAHLWALEQDFRAVPLSTTFPSDGKPIVLCVGNEISGVDPELLDMCERVVFIPMRGKKRSLNVEVAFGIAMSAIRSALP